jgi:hypothetical protein
LATICKYYYLFERKRNSRTYDEHRSINKTNVKYNRYKDVQFWREVSADIYLTVKYKSLEERIPLWRVLHKKYRWRTNIMVPMVPNHGSMCNYFII